MKVQGFPLSHSSNVCALLFLDIHISLKFLKPFLFFKNTFAVFLWIKYSNLSEI